MLFKKFSVVALSAILAIPLAGQPAATPAPRLPVSAHGAVRDWAWLQTVQSPAPQPGQTAPARKETAQKPVPAGKLEITILDGGTASNDIGARVGVAPKVRVLDEKGKPVSGAEVVFTLPRSGASGVFNGWIRTQTVKTDSDGVAATRSYTPNRIEGPFQIKVTARSGNSQGAALISQTNVPGTRKSNKKWIIIGVAAAAATVVAIAVAASGGENNTVVPNTPVVITPGAITVGGPK